MQDYEKAFSIDSGNKEKVPDEARSQQFLAFYQKELALYIRKHLDDCVTAFCLDKDLHPIFKVCSSTYRKLWLEVWHETYHTVSYHAVLYVTVLCLTMMFIYTGLAMYLLVVMCVVTALLPQRPQRHSAAAAQHQQAGIR